MEHRRRQAAEGLLKHSLFGFQVHDIAVSERLGELKELLLATCGERDQIALLSENIREIEEKLKSRSERFLLEPLRRFEQEMELLLDVGSGEDAATEEEDEDLLLTDDDQEMEECLSLSQDPVVSGTASQVSSPPRAPPAKPLFTKQKKTEEDEVRCGVCCAPDSLENDPIIICEVCGVAVHQTCYRLATVPEGDWYCHPCRQYLDSLEIEKNLIPTHELECEACCTKAGAMAPTIDGGWVHVACSMFLPELYVQDKHASRFQGPLDDLQVVCGVDKLKPRRRLRCCFCKKSKCVTFCVECSIREKGACAQCAVGKCVVAYHALCALRNGIKLRYMEDQGQFGSGCLKHQAQFLDMDGESESGIAVVDKNPLPESANKSKAKTSQNASSDEDDSESDDENDDDNELDSDSDLDGSQDSLSDDDHLAEERTHTLPNPTKMSPPRLLGAPAMKDSTSKQSNRSNRSRQIKLSFSSAEEDARSTQPVVPPKTACGPASSSSSNPKAVTPALVPQQHAVSSNRKDVDINSQVVLQTNVFVPAFYPWAYKTDLIDEQHFEYVMILISSRPLGLGVATSKESPGICLLAKSTRNPAIITALKRGVIQNGDEVFALNNLVLRNIDLKSFREDVVPAISLPVRCWFRTKRKSNSSTEASHVASLGGKTAVHGASINLASTRVSGKQQSVTPFATTVSPPGIATPDSHNIAGAISGQNPREGDVGVVSLGVDWPWVFLRSDGKLAMNLFWKTLDSAFFLRKINKRTFSQLQEKVEDMCGVRLSSSHSDYEQVRELLVMPRRERVPAYLVEFRKTREQKQKFLSSGIFMGESKDEWAEVDEQSPLEVGTTVSVAKRTWPGMNKLGGIGRVKKVNEEKQPNGKKRFTYNIAYVLTGNDKNVERKYISVVDVDADNADKNEDASLAIPGRRQKSEPEAETNEINEANPDTSSVRLIFTVSRTADEDKLTELLDAQIENPVKRRRLQLQFSTENAAVHCERKADQSDSSPPVKELLLHRYFPVKVPDALVNECYSLKLLSVENRFGDEIDEDDTDSENEVDEIKTELTHLQNQFRSAMESNELAFASLTKKVDEEYALKEYRQQELLEIQWRNYERMYQELQVAKSQFDDSGEGSDAGEDGRVPSSRANAESEAEDSENEDISFGGMFVNKLKQEGNEICALCELSGGDFTGTDSDTVVHPQCAMFTPETFFKDGVVHGINLVDPERRRLKCSICGGSKGLSKIQCAHRKCVRAYHVACAFVNGLLTTDPYYQAWCPRHLKTSGMGQFVELPDHLNKDKSATSSETLSVIPASSLARRNRKNGKQRSSQQKKHRSRKVSTPAEATTVAHADISSSKTNKKRKRKGSNASISTITSVGSSKNSRGSIPRSKIVVEGEEPRCARRLEIELSDDSDHEGKAVDAWQQGRDPQQVFIKNDAVEVLARDWRGINKPGGVARVRAVEVVQNKSGGKDVFYDVIHIVGAFKEKHLPAKFVRRYHPGDE